MEQSFRRMEVRFEEIIDRLERVENAREGQPQMAPNVRQRERIKERLDRIEASSTLRRIQPRGHEDMRKLSPPKVKRKYVWDDLSYEEMAANVFRTYQELLQKHKKETESQNEKEHAHIEDVESKTSECLKIEEVECKMSELEEQGNQNKMSEKETEEIKSEAEKESTNEREHEEKEKREIEGKIMILEEKIEVKKKSEIEGKIMIYEGKSEKKEKRVFTKKSEIKRALLNTNAYYVSSSSVILFCSQGGTNNVKLVVLNVKQSFVFDRGKDLRTNPLQEEGNDENPVKVKIRKPRFKDRSNASSRRRGQRFFHGRGI